MSEIRLSPESASALVSIPSRDTTYRPIIQIPRVFAISSRISSLSLAREHYYSRKASSESWWPLDDGILSLQQIFLASLQGTGFSRNSYRTIVTVIRISDMCVHLSVCTLTLFTWTKSTVSVLGRVEAHNSGRSWSRKPARRVTTPRFLARSTSGDLKRSKSSTTNNSRDALSISKSSRTTKNIMRGTIDLRFFQFYEITKVI